MPATPESPDDVSALTWGQLWPLIGFLTLVAALLAVVIVLVVLRR